MILFRMTSCAFSWPRVGAALLTLLWTLLPASIGRTAGIGVYTHGAAELGMSSAVIAHAEGPASNFWNPALNRGNQAEIGTSFIFPFTEYRSVSTGETEETESGVQFPSNLFATYQLSRHWVIGFGVNNTFGLATKWPGDWEGRYIATESELRTFNINPNITWIIDERFSVAAGVDFLYGSRAVIERKLDLSFLGLSDAGQQFEGDGSGWGYNLAFSANLAPGFSFGVSYRSPIDLELEGDVAFDLPADAPASVRTSLAGTGGKATLDLPGHVFAGLSFQPDQRWRFAVALRWEGWSRYKALNLALDQPIAGNDSIDVAADWENAIAYSVGIRYSLDETLALMCGLMVNNSAIPDDTFSPQIPGSDKTIYSLGVSKRFRGRFQNLGLAASYLFEDREKRRKNNSVGESDGGSANGIYRTSAHFFSLSIRYHY